MAQNATILHTTAPVFFSDRFARRLLVAPFFQGCIKGGTEGLAGSTPWNF